MLHTACIHTYIHTHAHTLPVQIVTGHTTVEILRFPRDALIKHLYSFGSGSAPFLGFGLL